MNLQNILLAILTFTMIGFAGCTKKTSELAPAARSNSEANTEKGYWTCPMHTHIRQDEAGKCPICGMPLVHVENRPGLKKETASGVEVTESQLKNANISRYTVVKKDFVVTLSLTGRVVSPHEVSFQVYESDVAVVKVGTEVSGYTSTNPDQSIKGRISQVDNLVDPSSRTIRANAKIQDAISNYVSETSFFGKIQNTFKNQILVPEDAVLHAGKRDLVYVFNQAGNIEPREVRIGIKNQGEYQILSGLAAGEVISAGANFLIDSEAKLRGP